MDIAPFDPIPVAKARLKNGLSGLVPRTHARSLTLLRAEYPGLEPDELAQRLVADATRQSAAFGVAAACCAFAPLPGAAPLVTAGDSAVTSALRWRLTAELHTVYGLLDPSPVNQGGTGYLAQWASRGSGDVVTSLAALPALALAATRALPKKLRGRLLRPRALFTATAVSAGLHRGRATRRYGEALRQDLRADPTAWSRWPDEPVVPR
ncbi:hypothetical protein [Actinospica sp.]|jgi:hypothetical protein|uniref:hypothetical protein n=1 Tax=Actinospica sp. TaxID=1872142 RepID=UPI002C1083A4|nr:hypothetical protein [Actinospica sp.]HWG23698.1 hypothetical protein [Actinospica sp.]